MLYECVKIYIKCKAISFKNSLKMLAARYIYVCAVFFLALILFHCQCKRIYSNFPAAFKNIFVFVYPIFTSNCQRTLYWHTQIYAITYTYNKWKKRQGKYTRNFHLYHTYGKPCDTQEDSPISIFFCHYYWPLYWYWNTTISIVLYALNPFVVVLNNWL